MVEALPEGAITGNSAASETAETESTAAMSTSSAQIDTTKYSEEESKKPVEEVKTDGPEIVDLTDDSKVPVTNLVDWKVEHGKKCKVFMDWCEANGVIQPKVEYPAYFEGGLVGVRAT